MTDHPAIDPPLLTTQVSPHDHLLLNRVAQETADWHNRHWLARRIKPGDVHTIGVIALPFMRVGQAPGSGDPALEHLEDPANSEAAAAFEAMAADADHARAFGRAPSLWKRLRERLPGARPAADLEWPAFSEQFLVGVSAKQAAAFAFRYGYTERPGSDKLPLRGVPVDESLMSGPPGRPSAWPAERFLLSAAIEIGEARSRVLLAQGPGQRLIFIGPRCLHPGRMIAATVGFALSLGIAALLLVQPAQKHKADAKAPAAAASTATNTASGSLSPAPSAPALPPSAAAAASAAEPAASVQARAVPASTPATAAPATATATPAATPGASPAPTAASSHAATPASTPISTAASAPASPPASAKPALPAASLPATEPDAPDIRPKLGPVRPRRDEEAKPQGKDKPATTAPEKSSDKPAEKHAEKAAGKATAEKATEKSGEKSAEKATDKALARDGTKPAEAATEKGSARTKPEGRTAETDRRDAVRAVEGKSEARAALADGGKQVALVAQPVASRAEAESILLRMRSMVSGTLKDSNALQGQVFQTPEGWRAAVWPFSSREEAQLINATLVARGLRTKAVDF